ncbi:transport and Golgi organization 2 homolog isoform X2 [Homarus americanus]|uniref:transport and Golgi organization 2 homolog isoform X2 n=1 Tax=Homarus americanus TaxID=6706 RepID=UPI001C4851C9|nr:transport and Golgi organization 2 homolog isoform X2 [Homarus americanus]
MCLLFLYINPDPKKGEYKLVLVNNRDESYQRPTKKAHLWDSNLYGGMDIQSGKEGGTWLALSQTGKIGCLLNILTPKEQFQPEATSRGQLIVDYLLNDLAGMEYLEKLKMSGTIFNPFNLLTMDWGEDGYRVSYYNSEDKVPADIEPGIHGFGNSPNDKPFKKVNRGEKRLKEIIEACGRVGDEARLLKELFTMMEDSTKNLPDHQLMEQGRGYSDELINSLSSIWVTAATWLYGTRTTTVILVDNTDRVVFKERTMREPINLDDIEWDALMWVTDLVG